MSTPSALEIALDDLLADLHHARRNEDLGRLALLAYCEVRDWSRRAGKSDISRWTTRMFTENPSVSRSDFLESVDTLIDALERHRQNSPMPSAVFPSACASGSGHPAF